MQVAQRITADEFLALRAPPGQKRDWKQLVEGEVIMDLPLWRHSVVQTEILGALFVWSKAAPGRGKVGLPLDVKLDERNVFGPDVLWYPESVELELDRRPYPIPGLAVEVRSPSTWRYDVGAKKAAYERHGTPELWLADTIAAQVLVFRRSRPDALSFDVALELGEDDVLTSPLLEGFELALRDLFPPPA